MIPELLGGVEVYRGFMHQTEVRELEDAAEDDIQFYNPPIGTTPLAALYDDSSTNPAICTLRSFLYILGDMRDLLGNHELGLVMIRQLKKPGLSWRKAPENTNSTLLMPIGGFDDGHIDVGNHRVPVTAGDCLIVPHDVRFRVPPFKDGKMYLITAHASREESSIPLRAGL